MGNYADLMIDIVENGFMVTVGGKGGLQPKIHVFNDATQLSEFINGWATAEVNI